MIICLNGVQALLLGLPLLCAQNQLAACTLNDLRGCASTAISKCKLEDLGGVQALLQGFCAYVLELK